ncbi:MAG: hypothetical protein N4A71_27300 [Carboxylicivirga sp.]|jgi:hypothetical protein|nr:hypothetical protein [Carboxylicivirga sp.]
MNKSELLKSAEQLPSVPAQALSEYQAKSGRMVEELNELLLSNNEITRLIGYGNIDLMKNNHENHVQFMSSVFENFNAETLVSTVLWVFKVYRNRNFHPDYWQEQLQGWISIIKTNLNEVHHTEILMYYQWMLKNINVFTQLTDVKENIS